MFKFVALLCLFSCVTTPPPSPIVPFKYFEKTFIAVPVVIDGDIHSTFILDTGIGVNLISKSLCQKISCVTAGEYTGKRMSGQKVTVQTTTIKKMAVGSGSVDQMPVGVFDIETLMPGSDIGGFLSLAFFKNQPFTVDYKTKTLTFETADSLKQIRSSGDVVQVTPDGDTISLSVNIPFMLPNQQEISVEVDTGSQALILDERFMSPLGVSKDDKNVRRRSGKDETDHEFNRFFTKLSGAVGVAGSRQTYVNGTDVMFQKIIYDGLVGHDFLSQFLVTYDLPSSQMIFRKKNSL